MKKFKILQIYVVEAESPEAAIEKFARAINPTAFLDGQFVKDVEEGGWKKTAKKQLA